MSKSEESPLTQDEIQIVTSNWNLVKQDTIKNGIGLFMTFFKMYPKYQQNFSFRNVPYDQLLEDKRLKRHAAGVMAALTSLVDNLEHLEVLVSLLEGLGERHGKRGIDDVAFDDLKETVVVVLREGLGTIFDEDAEKAWRKTLDVANSIIKQNLHNDDK